MILACQALLDLSAVTVFFRSQRKERFMCQDQTAHWLHIHKLFLLHLGQNQMSGEKFQNRENI